jgi:hypothetical protein
MAFVIYRADVNMALIKDEAGEVVELNNEESHPTNPEETGWHIFASKTKSGLLPIKWCAKKQGYLRGDGDVFSLEEITKDLIYQGATSINFDKSTV